MLKADFKKSIDDLDFLWTDKEFCSAAKRFTKFIKKSTKSATGVAKIIDVLKNAGGGSIKKKIRVQKASIMRRSCGRTTTSSLASGRTPSSFLKPRGIGAKLRKHSLSDAIKNSTQNGGKF